MKNRLYNKYGAATGEHPETIGDIISEATKKIIDYTKENNLDIHDVEGWSLSCMHADFCEEKMRNGIKTRKEERE